MKFEKIIFFVLFVFMFFSCGQNDKNNNIDNVETGGISLSLVWDTGDSNNQSQNAPAEKNSIKYAAPAGVVTIRVTISGTGMNDISQSFAASAGSGTITGVPVGSNRTAKIEGYDASNNVIYYAYKTNITVQQNLTTNAGTVTMISATKPYIDHTAVGTSSKDNAITITALVNDYTNVNSVTLYYKKNSDANYTSVSMKKTSGDYYSEVIPANIVTENVTYYISAYNGINYIYCGSSGISNSNPSSNPITVTILTTSRILFDNFPNSVLNSSIWNTASSGILNNFYFYSSQYSYRLNQTNALISNSVNLNQNDGTLYLDFYYRPYNGVSTDKLYAKFYDSNGVWQTLTSLTAGDSSYWRLGRVNIPYYNLHSNFKLKLESSTAYPNYYFFVDDILLKRLYPLITHSAVDNVKSGATANISANIASENSISSVKLFYKKSNSNAYSDTDMLKTSGTTYQANLPSSYLTTGIDYFIQATDNNITSYYDNKGLNVSGFYPMTIKLNLLDDSFYSTQWNSIWYDKSSSEITSNDYITSPYSMRLKYVDYIYTNAMNLSSSSDNLTLSFYYKGSGTTSTDKLYVKYYDSNSTWQMLSDTIVGTPFSSWLYQTIFIPTVYLHSNFKLRFEAATSSTSKYFYIDNIQLKTTVEDAMYTISTPMPAPGSTITRGTSGQSLMIKCPGATGGTFYYDVDNNLSYNVAGTMDSDFLKVNVPYGSVMTNSGYNNWYVKVNYPDGRQITYPEKASNTKGFLQFNVTSTQIVSNPYPAQGSLIKTTSLFQTFRVHCPGASYARFYYSTYSSFYYYGNTSYITPTGDYIECAVPYSNSYITNNGINYWYAQIYYPNNSSIRFPASMYFQFDSFSNYFAANPTPDINQLISQNVYSVENGQFFKIYAPGASYARFYYSTYSSFYYYGNTSYITPTGDYIECTVPYSNSYITNNGINYWYAQIYFPNNTNFRFPISGYFYFPVATSYTISNPLPANNSTVTPGANGQNFKIYAPAAKYARIYYSTYSSFYNYNYTSNISPTGGYIECTIPYSNSYITNKGINYWYVQIYYNYDTVRYPLSGYLNFTVN